MSAADDLSGNSGVDPEELSELQAEVDDLAERLADAERELAATRDALDQFEMLYRREIAGRLAAVEELQARLEALRGRDTAEAQRRADDARRVADAMTPKERYRSLAKRIHPDRFSDDPQLKAEAEELTKRLTDAWRRRDENEIDKIEAEIDRRFAGDAPPKERLGILRRLRERLSQQIDALSQSIDALRTGALWDLFQRAEEARTEGRDLLAEQAADLDEVAVALRDEIEVLEADMV